MGFGSSRENVKGFYPSSEEFILSSDKYQAKFYFV